jgi:hypothetical protein
MLPPTCRGLGNETPAGFALHGQRPGGRDQLAPEAAMPNRRTMELIVITVLLLHPVLAMAHVWGQKHIATHDASTIGEVVSALT